MKEKLACQTNGIKEIYRDKDKIKGEIESPSSLSPLGVWKREIAGHTEGVKVESKESLISPLASQKASSSSSASSLSFSLDFLDEDFAPEAKTDNSSSNGAKNETNTMKSKTIFSTLSSTSASTQLSLSFSPTSTAAKVLTSGSISPEALEQAVYSHKNLNEHITSVLGEIEELYSLLGQEWRAMGFKKGAAAIAKLRTPLRSPEDIRALREGGENRTHFTPFKRGRYAERYNDRLPRTLPFGITEKLLGHVGEIIATGTCTLLEDMRTTKHIASLRQLSRVHGIGPRRARALYESGIVSIDLLKASLEEVVEISQGTEEKQLNRLPARISNLKSEKGAKKDQIITESSTPMTTVNTLLLGLQYLNDIERRIPRNEVRAIRDFIGLAARTLFPSAYVVCCGSFRRGKATSGDVDILLSHHSLRELSFRSEFWDEKENVDKSGNTKERDGLDFPNSTKSAFFSSQKRKLEGKTDQDEQERMGRNDREKREWFEAASSIWGTLPHHKQTIFVHDNERESVVLEDTRIEPTSPSNKNDFIKEELVYDEIIFESSRAVVLELVLDMAQSAIRWWYTPEVLFSQRRHTRTSDIISVIPKLQEIKTVPPVGEKDGFISASLRGYSLASAGMWESQSEMQHTFQCRPILTLFDFVSRVLQKIRPQFLHKSRSGKSEKSEKDGKMRSPLGKQTQSHFSANPPGEVWWRKWLEELVRSISISNSFSTFTATTWLEQVYEYAFSNVHISFPSSITIPTPLLSARQFRELCMDAAELLERPPLYASWEIVQLVALGRCNGMGEEEWNVLVRDLCSPSTFFDSSFTNLIPSVLGPFSSHHQAGDTWMGICRLPSWLPLEGEDKTCATFSRYHRRLDIKIYSAPTLPFALLYFTGSDHFNRSMRLFARKLGLSLSDKDLRPVSRVENVKFGLGKTLFAQTEKDIFTALGLVYVEPYLRSTDSNFCDISVQSVSDSYSPTSSIVKSEGRIKIDTKRSEFQEEQMVASRDRTKREAKNKTDNNYAAGEEKDIHQAFQLSLDLDLGSIDLT